MKQIIHQPCELGTTPERDNPRNREAATAIALHDATQKAFCFSMASPDTFESGLRVIEAIISSYRELANRK